MSRRSHAEIHAFQRIGWLRAAVLGANDGILSVAGLIVGVGAASQSRGAVLVAGVAAVTAGALSMAAGEYVSVSSQADAERADLARETEELAGDPEFELEELADIYVARGVEPGLAREIAQQLMAKDALGAHARDELGISASTSARPVQAAVTSAAMFAAGAFVPLAAAALAPRPSLVLVVVVTSVVCLAGLGAVGAAAGRGAIWTGVARVTFWGALAMAVSAGVGALFNVEV